MDEIKGLLEELSLLMAGLEDLAILIGSSDVTSGSNCMCVLAKYGRERVEELSKGITTSALTNKSVT